MCRQLLIDGFTAINFFILIAEYRLCIKKGKIQTPKLMMRVYSSILMSSLLLSGTAVSAQSLETRSTFFAQHNCVPEILTAVADTQTFYADNDKNTPPERGEGR
ncbi:MULTISPECIES: heterocyst-inhibiting protein PatX [unclassified Microcoleus]|uniref:heterocyst-inhibiting protein PatX n=1 Tax=unclassified Microcoleus TaxID=2642155 RepID=UPI002FD6896A